MKALSTILILISLSALADDPTPSPAPNPRTNDLVVGQNPEAPRPAKKLKKNTTWKKAKKPSPVNEVPPAPLPRQ